MATATAEPLQVKSFFGASIKEALANAHLELGPDALLLNARESAPECSHLGVCEVVMGVASSEEPDAGRPSLMEWQPSPDLIPGLGHVTALVGPPGTGKTSTLVKLAIVEGLRAGRSPRLITADTQRIGAAEQLRTFASILGVPFRAVESPAALALAIEAAPLSDLVLIDTPGYDPACQKHRGTGLADFFSRCQNVDIHLVLTASTDPAVLRKLIGIYRAYRPSKLLFTHLDEVDSLASVYSEALYQQMPLSYFGLGQSIPEDLEAASAKRLSESMERRLPTQLQAVA
jgi:flagellar biosynthesis GTPase FlhF